VNEVRKLLTALAMTTALVAVAAATGALPTTGARYSGLTSAKKVNGFQDSVTFVAGTKTLKRLSFGTLGCFGFGQFPVGVDPYGTSLAQIGPVPMNAKGEFTIASAVASWSGGDSSTKLLVSVTGKFVSKTSATGVIAVSEKSSNGGKCGPSKMSFTAKPGQIPSTG
jgi:hypothetical protein